MNIEQLTFSYYPYIIRRSTYYFKAFTKKEILIWVQIPNVNEDAVQIYQIFI